MEITEFLVRAKKTTYAAGGGSPTVLDDGCMELVYDEDEWSYRDRYFGFNPFIGEEVVFKEDVPVWGMNYHGMTLVEAPASQEIYDFLMEALSLVTLDRPFRGPDKLLRDDWSYVMNIRGTVSEFHGSEIIRHKEVDVYQLRFHGGEINK